MYLIIGFAMIVGLIVVGTLIPPDARYEIWPHRRRLKSLMPRMGTKMSASEVRGVRVVGVQFATSSLVCRRLASSAKELPAGPQ